VEEIEMGLHRLGMKYTIYRTRNTVTLDFLENSSNCPDPELVMSRVQLILRLYWNIGEVLTGFDVDCCCFAFDGKRVWGTERGLEAFSLWVNLVDLSRASRSYVSRMLKYADRGWAVVDKLMRPNRMCNEKVGVRVPTGGWRIRGSLVRSLKETIDNASPGLETLHLAEVYYRCTGKVLVPRPEREPRRADSSSEDVEDNYPEDSPEIGGGAVDGLSLLGPSFKAATRYLAIPLRADTTITPVIGPGRLGFKIGGAQLSLMTEADWVKHAYKKPRA
jgi:hypothetical protein